MKQLVSYMAFNQLFIELFEEGIEVRKISNRIKNLCPTGYVLSVENVSKKKAKNYIDFRSREEYEKNKMEKSLTGK